MAVPPLTPLATAVLRVGRPERILELECGDGEATLFLAREFPQARLRGVDRDEGAVRRATSRVGLDPEGRVAFKTGSPADLPFPDGLFDLVVAVDAAARYTEAARVLSPGGHLLSAWTVSQPISGGPRGWLEGHRRRRHGFEPVEAGSVGGGGFSILRLPGPSSHGADV